MANANVAKGFLPYRHYDGSVWNGSLNMYFVPASYATALFIGDPVDIVSSSNDANGIPAVQIGVTGSPIVGFFAGIVNGGQFQAAPITVTRDLPIYRPASVAQYILVCDDPTILLECQDNAGTQATAANLWAGKNANFISGSGSTTTGYSGYQLSAASVATTNTLDLKIMRPLTQIDNVISSTANTGGNAKWLVKMNNHRYAGQTAGV